MFRECKNNSNRWMLAAGAAFIIGLAMPGEAQAGRDWSFHVDLGHDHTPVYEQVARTVRVEPVYEYRRRRVWIPAVYEERIVTVEIAPVIRHREVPVYDSYGRVSGYRRVAEVIEPARVEERVEKILLREGYYTSARDRVLVRAGRERVVYHRVRIGHRRGEDGLRIGFGYGKDHHDRHDRYERRGLRRLIRRAIHHARH